MRGARVDFANTLRGWAALCVVISHYFSVFWISRGLTADLIYIPELPADIYTPAYIKFLNFIPVFNWGAYGVSLFFMISGFVIPFSLRKMNVMGFIVSRFFRLIPVYMVGFSITLSFLWLGGEYFLREWPFTLREVLIHYMPGIRDVALSKSIDGVIWTLEIEMKFYVICAIFIDWFRRYSLKVFLIPLSLFMIGLTIDWKVGGWLANHIPALHQFSLVFMRVSQYIIVMFIGVVFHYLYQHHISVKRACQLVGGLFLLFCLHLMMTDAGLLYLAWSYVVALATFFLAYSYPRFFRSNRVFNFMADISYPMYVIHGVSGYVALRILLDRGWQPWAALCFVTAACFSLSWLLHKYIEVPSQMFGKKLAESKVVVSDDAYGTSMDA